MVYTNMDNVILTYNNIELYKSEIDILCDEYINTLYNADMIYKSAVFSGLLHYIYQNKLKFIIPDTYNHDYKLLNDIFDNIYIYLCTRFNIVPNIIQFTVLCHIDKSLISEIKSGVYKDGSRVKSDTSETVKRWYSICESMLLSKATNESSIGSIFALKANYGYQEQPQRLEIVNNGSNATPEQIAEKYKDVKKPEIPEILS